MSLGFYLGQEGFKKYQDELVDWIKQENVLDFLLWFERTAVRHLPEAMSFDELVVLERVN